MKREHMPFKYMGQFKAVAADYEYYLSLSDKPRQVCLTERQMYIMQVWNTYTPWMTRWYNTDDVSEAQLRTIAAEIEDILMCYCGIPEPSLTDRFNSTTYITNTGDTYETTYNTWNTGGQTVSSIAPDLDFGTGDPGNISKVTCLALGMLLDAIIEAAKQQKQNLDQPNRDLVKGLGGVFAGLSTAGGAAIAVGGGAASFVAFLGGPYLVLGLALAAVGMGIANLVWSTDLSVFNDAEAIDDVRCCMINNMSNDTLDRASFMAGLGCSLTGNAAQLATVVQAYLNDLDTYLQFLTTTQGLYEVSDFGVLPECGCIEPVCDGAAFGDDFRTSNGGFVESVAGYGTWHPGQGWGVGSFGFTVTVEKPITDSIIRVRMFFNENTDGAVFLRQTLANGFATFTGPTTNGTEGGLWWYEFDVPSGITTGICLQANPSDADKRLVKWCGWTE